MIREYELGLQLRLATNFPDLQTHLVYLIATPESEKLVLGTPSW